MADARYLTFLGRGPRQVVHWEHWSDPDAETYLTGIKFPPSTANQKLFAAAFPSRLLPELPCIKNAPLN